MVNSLVFGLGYKARHGKDTVASLIKKHRGDEYDIEVTSFASALKREVNEAAMKSGGMRNLFAEGLRIEGCGYLQENGNILALPEWVQYDPHAPMDDPMCPLGKQRTLLQFWGTEFRRSINPDYWVKKTAEYLEKRNPEIAILSDMRFFNEKAFVEEYGESIKVTRPRFDAGVPPHVSELVLDAIGDDDFGACIYNDGTLEELEKKALYIFDMLMERTQ